jgi:branched-subunit amino acid transport protein
MSGYSAPAIVLLLVLLVIVTLVARNFFLVLPRRWQPRGRMERALRVAPLAAIVAITLPEVLQTSVLAGTAPSAWLLDARLLAVLALALAWRLTRHGVVALASGAVVFVLLGALAR